MIIEPTPTNPRSPVRRGLRLALLLVPVVLLGAVAGAGLLGPRPDAPSPPEPVAAGSSPDATIPPAGATAAPATTPVRTAEPPTQFGDLPTTTVGEALDAQRQGRDTPAIALTGFLRLEGPVDGGCIDEAGGPLGPWCEREGTLSDASRASRDTPEGAIAPHVHLSIPVGVRMPTAGLVTTKPADEDPHVLVIGRLGASGPRCGIGPDTCEEVFVVERFAWSDGVRVGLTPLIEPRLDTGERRPNPFAFLDEADLPMSAILVWPDALTTLDPAAARVAEAGPPSEPVWYVRVLDGARGPGLERGVRWMVMAERDLQVLGAGRPAVGVASMAPEGSG